MYLFFYKKYSLKLKKKNNKKIELYTMLCVHKFQIKAQKKLK